MKKQVKHQHSLVSDHDRLKASHAQLEKAHTDQSAFVQKLQNSQGKLAAYRSTITMQEKVIAKLEGLLEARVKQRGGGRTADQPFFDELERLKVENQKLKRASNEPSVLAAAASMGVDQTFSNEAKDARILALEEQMLLNARDAAQQIAKLKLKLFELELDGENGDSMALGTERSAGGSMPPLPPSGGRSGGGGGSSGRRPY